MPIPAIAPYRLPEDVPAAVPSWRPDPERALLLLHDMQRYFLAPYPRAVPPLSTLLDNVVRLRDAAHRHGVPVVYTAQPGGMDPVQRGLLADFWGEGMRADDEERGIVPHLAPRPDDVVLTKWRYSAFHHTGLDDVLRRSGRDQLVITGVYANTGCLATAVDAFSRDLETFLVRDAIADFTAADHEQALRYAASRCASIPTTAEMLADLATPSTPVSP